MNESTYDYLYEMIHEIIESNSIDTAAHIIVAMIGQFNTLIEKERKNG